MGDRLAAVPSPFGLLGVTIYADNFPESLVFGQARAHGVRVRFSPCASATVRITTTSKTPTAVWITSCRRLAELYHMSVIGVSCVGWLTGGPWKGRKCNGNCIAIGPRGKELAIGAYGADAEALTVVEVSQTQRVARGAGKVSMHGSAGT